MQCQWCLWENRRLATFGSVPLLHTISSSLRPTRRRVPDSTTVPDSAHHHELARSAYESDFGAYSKTSLATLRDDKLDFARSRGLACKEPKQV